MMNEEELLRQVVWPSHEPLAFLRRRGGLTRGYEADYERYHTAANTKILAQLLGPGGMCLMHFYKGMGLKHEAAEMRRCYALAREMHRQGLGVCVYLGGTMHTETMYRDHPEARDWACGCKQPRISQALSKRFFFYLTADERIGDLLDETLLADQHIGDALVIAPGWDALASNWLTAWERRGESRWRERLLAGLDGISALPRGLIDGPAVRYDPGTGAIRQYPGSSGGYLLMNVFGSFETWSELLSLLPHAKFAEALAEYGRWYGATPAERAAGLAADVRENFTAYAWPSARFTGWAARRGCDPELARRAWARLLTRDTTNGQHIPTPPRQAMDRLRGEPVDEMQPSTNCAAQWCLNAIELLALVPEALDAGMAGILGGQGKEITS